MTEKQNDHSEAMMRQSVRVPSDLYDWARQAHGNFSETCRLALEKLREVEATATDDNQLTEWQTQTDAVVHSVLDMQAVVTGVMKTELDFKNEQIRQLSITCDTLLAQLVEERARSKELLVHTRSKRWWQIW